MKTKFLILSIISVFIFSCKSDDESGSGQQNPVVEKLVETINLNGILLAYTFNEDKTVEKLDFGVAESMLFTYTENRISSIEYDDDVFEFVYDVNGKIKSFSIGIDQVDVIYNAAENSYSYEMEEGKEITLILAENGDVNKYSILDTQTQEIVRHEYFYDNSKNGVLTNSNNIAVYLVMVTGFYDIGLYASKRPIQTFSSNGIAFSFENTYDDDIFVTKSIINGTNTVYYAYNQ